MVGPLAQVVVAMGTDGRVSSQGSLSDALEHDQTLAEEVAKESQAIEKAEHDIQQDQSADETKKPDGKLVVSEEVSEGHVGWPACKFSRSTDLIVR